MFQPAPLGFTALNSQNVSSSNPVILCLYQNTTSHLQILRISNDKDCLFERVAFPGQRILFEALPEAQLEIHSTELATSVLADTIICARLKVEAVDSPAEHMSFHVSPQKALYDAQLSISS